MEIFIVTFSETPIGMFKIDLIVWKFNNIDDAIYKIEGLK